MIGELHFVRFSGLLTQTPRLGSRRGRMSTDTRIAAPQGRVSVRQRRLESDIGSLDVNQP